MTNEEIEKQSKELWEKNKTEKDFNFDGEYYKKGFIAGANFILDSAASGFDEWIKIQPIDDPNHSFRNNLEREFYIGFGKGYREGVEDAWQAAKLSTFKDMKHTNEQLVAKDEEIKSLKKDLKWALGWIDLAKGHREIEATTGIINRIKLRHNLE